MDGKFEITVKENFVHVVQTGPDSYEISLAMWKQIAQTCNDHKIWNVLGETATSSPLSTKEAYDHIEIFRICGITIKHCVAWVHHGEDVDGSMRFAETVLKNRGMLRGKFCESYEQAERWLNENGVPPCSA